jgi:hypothetical protein
VFEHPKEAEWLGAAQRLGQKAMSDLYRKGLSATCMAVVVLGGCVLLDMNLRWLVVCAVGAVGYVCTVVASLGFVMVLRGISTLSHLSEEVESRTRGTPNS